MKKEVYHLKNWTFFLEPKGSDEFCLGIPSQGGHMDMIPKDSAQYEWTHQNLATPCGLTKIWGTAWQGSLAQLESLLIILKKNGALTTSEQLYKNHFT